MAKTLAPGGVAKKPATKGAALPRSGAAPDPAPAPGPVAAPKGRLFAVTRSRSVSWDPSRPLEEQYGWADHAQFMDGLEASGFVVAGGPLQDTPYTFLAVRAENESEVRAKFAADPWEQNRILETTRIVGWDLKLGAGRL